MSAPTDGVVTEKTAADAATPVTNVEPQPRPSSLDSLQTDQASIIRNDVILREEAPASPLNLRFSFNFDERNELSMSHAIEFQVPPQWSPDGTTPADSSGATAVAPPRQVVQECNGTARRKLKEGRADGFGKVDAVSHMSKPARNSPPKDETYKEGMVKRDVVPATSDVPKEGHTAPTVAEPSMQDTPPAPSAPADLSLPASLATEQNASQTTTLEPPNSDTAASAQRQHGKKDELNPTRQNSDMTAQPASSNVHRNTAPVLPATFPSTTVRSTTTETIKTAKDDATNKPAQLEQGKTAATTHTKPLQARSTTAPVATTEKPRVEYTLDNVYPTKWEDSTPAIATAPVKTSMPANASKGKIQKVVPKQRQGLSHTTPPSGSGASRSKAQQAVEHQLKALHHASHSEVAALKVQLQCVTVERDGLQTRWERAMADLADLAGQFQRQHVQVATSDAEREAFAQQCASLQQAVAAAQAEADTHRKKLMAVQAELHQAKAKCSVAEGKVEALAKGRAEAASKLDTAKQTISRLQTSVEHAKDKLHKLEVENASLRNKRAADGQKMAQTVDQVTHHAAAAMEKATAQWAVELAAKEASVRAQVDKAKRAADDANAILHRRNTALETKLKDSKGRIALLENQVRPVQLLAKRVKALEGVHDENKRLQQELITAHREAAFAAKNNHAKSKSARDEVVSWLDSPAKASNQTQHSPSKDHDADVVEALRAEVERLQGKLAAQELQVVQLRELHSQELHAQSAMFQRHLGRAT